MSKYVDKMNLPQYRFYNHMVGEGEERKELVSDLLTAEMILEGGGQERAQPGVNNAGNQEKTSGGFHLQPGGGPETLPEGSDRAGHEAVSETPGPLSGYAAHDPILSRTVREETAVCG